MPANLSPSPRTDDRFEAHGFSFADSQERVVARFAGLEVCEQTAIYEDETLRGAVMAHLGHAGDQTWRFAFHSHISFSPPLPPGIGPAAVWPIVVRKTFQAFVDDLRSRGVRIVRREPGHRTRANDGHQIYVEHVTGELVLKGQTNRRISIEGWVGLGRREGEYHVVGGAFPTVGLPAGVRIAPEIYRQDLRELIRTTA